MSTDAANFLKQIIEKDIEAKRLSGGVVTRFPPEPNGYLHLGHAKSICLNFGLAEDYNGRCHLRFDDTNPETEDVEYVESIKADVKWLGADWKNHLYFASDYFQQLYLWAEELIQNNKAYVCSLNEEQLRLFLLESSGRCRSGQCTLHRVLENPLRCCPSQAGNSCVPVKTWIGLQN